MKRLTNLLVIGCLTSIFLAGPSIAEDMGSISCGETRSAAITAAGEVDTWAFAVSAGDRAMICVGKASGTLSLWVTLYAPDGSKMLAGDGHITFVASEAGTHMVAVRDREGSGSGEYGITFLDLAVCSGDAISCNETCSGTIDGTAEMDVWEFSASAGDYVMLCFRGTSGALSTYASIYGPDGSRVTYGGLRCSFRPSQAGTHKVVIHDGGFNDTGTYNITLLNLESCPGPTISCNETQSGSIDAATDMEIWQFWAMTSERIMLSVMPTSGDLHPYMRLYAPDGSEEAYEDIHIYQSINQTGIHTVLIHDGKDGGDDASYEDSGGYNITFLNRNRSQQSRAV